MDRELLIDQVDHQQRIFNQPFKIILVLVDRYCSQFTRCRVTVDR
jgi:hypothetical protein